MRATSDTPIFATLITELGERQRAAEAVAADLRATLADVEALHEPDAGGECPTCGTTAPCPTLLLVHREIDLTTACAAVRGEGPLAARGDHEAPARGPEVPRLSELLDSSTAGVDRFFDSLLK